MNDNKYYIGIDGGGTHCRARLEDANGELLSEALSGPCNIMRDCQLAIQSIEQAVEGVLKNANKNISPSQCIVGAGLAGANIPLAASHFSKWQHPFLQLTLLSDLHAACLGAHSGVNGAVIIIGTGSSGTVYNNGEFSDTGGHGFPIGDIGSGAWLGLRAIQHTLLGLDGLGPFDPLCHAVLSHLNVTSAHELVEQTAKFRTSDYAAIVSAFIPLIQKEDKATTPIINEGLKYINKLAEKLIGDSPKPLALIGGLSNVYAERLPSHLKQYLVNSAASPQQGSILFAKQKIKNTELV
jgi:glucosamine kinase